MMPEVQCRACRLLEESGDHYYCPEKGRELDGLYVSNVRVCKHYQPAETFGSEMHEDHVMGFMAPVGAVAMPRAEIEKARDGIMAKVKEKRKDMEEMTMTEKQTLMVEMYRQGDGTNTIAKALGLSQSVVYRALLNAGVKMRPVKGGRKSGKSPGKKACVSKKTQNVSQMTQQQIASEVAAETAVEVAAECIAHHEMSPRFHCAEDNLEEFLRDWFGNLAPRRTYQLPPKLRQKVHELTKVLLEKDEVA